VIAALALVFAMFIMVQQPADAAPQSGAVASVALPAIGAPAQINFAQLICPILLQIRASFAGTPFFSFVQPIIDQLLAQFGCVPGTTTTTVAPTTTTTVAPTTTTTVAPTTTTTVSIPPIPGLNLGQITCPILLQLRAAFVGSPFFSSFVPIIDQLLVAFGCIVSG
jgi:hypothetical protein